MVGEAQEDFLVVSDDRRPLVESEERPQWERSRLETAGLPWQ